MIHSAGAGVKTPARLPFAFRADPVALDGLKLPRTARDVFVLILDNAKSRGWRSRLSNGTLARILGCCEMTVGRALLALERAGLIARDFTHGGRVRTGIRVTWDALQQRCGTERPCVQQERGTGSTSAWEGSNMAVELTRVLSQSEKQTMGFLPPGKDPGEVPDPATAAAFLRSMIQAGRKAGACTTTPSSSARPMGAYTTPPPVHETDGGPAPVYADPRKTQTADVLVVDDAVAKGVLAEDTFKGVTAVHTPPSRPSQGSPRREVACMVRDLAVCFAKGRTQSPRMTPWQLQRQIAEVRRRYGAEKSQPRA